MRKVSISSIKDIDLRDVANLHAICFEESWRANVLKSISVIEMDFNINDSPFVEAVTSQLLLNLSGNIA